MSAVRAPAPRTSWLAAAPVLVLVLVPVPGCRDAGSKSGGAGSDASAAAVPAAAAPKQASAHPKAASTRYPAIDPPMPSLVHVGGRFITHPRVVTVTWKNDDLAVVQKLEAFGAAITRGAWWAEVTKDLCAASGECIGKGGEPSSARIDEAAPKSASLGELARKIASLVDRGALPKPDDDRVFVVYLPKDATVTGLTDACHGTRAQHTTFAWPKDADTASRPITFILRCSDDVGELTGTASHEILEASTDPTLDGFQLDRAPEYKPFGLYGVEAVDPCTLVTQDDHRANVEGWMVHRAWSGKEARAGRDPCVPHRASDPYVAVVPKEPIVRMKREDPRAVVELTGVSQQEVPNWSVSAFELGALKNQKGCLSLSFDTREANNGSKVLLTIEAVNLPCLHGGGVLLVSTLGTRSHAWPLLVEVK